jgi:hypothetical protein
MKSGPPSLTAPQLRGDMGDLAPEQHGQVVVGVLVGILAWTAATESSGLGAKF